ETLKRTAAVLGCDPALGILTAHFAAKGTDGRVIWLNTASQSALDAVARGEAHIAGTHLRDADGAAPSYKHARQTLPRTGGLGVEFGRWEQGFVVQAGNPKAIRRVEDLGRPDVRLVNREAGSGSRALLDELMAAAGLTENDVAGYQHVVNGHML